MAGAYYREGAPDASVRGQASKVKQIFSLPYLCRKWPVMSCCELEDSQYHRAAMRLTANFRVSSASSSAAAKGMSTSQALNGSGAVLKIAWPQGW